MVHKNAKMNSVILLQIDVVIPGTLLVKNHDSHSGTIESQFKKCVQNWKCFQRPLCNQTVNLKADSKTLYYSILKLKYSESFYFKAQQRLNERCIVKHNNSNCHSTCVITQTEYFRSINWSLCPMGRMLWIILRLWGFLCFRDARHTCTCKGNKLTVNLAIISSHLDFMLSL